MLSLLYCPALTSIPDYWKNHSFDYMVLCRQNDVSAFEYLNMLSKFVIAFLPGSKCLWISWLRSPSAVILEPKKRKSATVFIFFSPIYHEVMGPDAMIFIFWMLRYKPACQLILVWQTTANFFVYLFIYTCILIVFFSLYSCYLWIFSLF